jgi:adenosyl cobinamide kinase/adenosyl cobinamide phosphate guanylyltransferase
MIFVTGPLFAGKQEYIMQALGWDQDAFERLAVRDVQDLAAHTPEEELPSLADRLAEKKVVIATEVGGGVVPMDPSERERREMAGCLSCELAGRAETVIRVCCGLPQLLKGEWP